MTRQTDYPDIMHKILSAKLCTHTILLTYLLNPLLPFQITECAAGRIARGWQVIKVTGRGQLHGLESHLGRGAADDNGKMIRRTGRGAQILNLLPDEPAERSFVQQRLRLLV